MTTKSETLCITLLKIQNNNFRPRCKPSIINYPWSSVSPSFTSTS
jgi:hypothetical protein